jgi:hypothetical protein
VYPRSMVDTGLTLLPEHPQACNKKKEVFVFPHTVADEFMIQASPKRATYKEEMLDKNHAIYTHIQGFQK